MTKGFQSCHAANLSRLFYWVCPGPGIEPGPGRLSNTSYTDCAIHYIHIYMYYDFDPSLATAAVSLPPKSVIHLPDRIFFLDSRCCNPIEDDKFLNPLPPPFLTPWAPMPLSVAVLSVVVPSNMSIL
jgi:hypothetical protein